ncbi:hypothetical protein HanIR_Chr10g0469771 [Helianthus annuus]|nr:hypothetical protein HanIR_Chr10g0469771 [Helianthus annuus]
MLRIFSSSHALKSITSSAKIRCETFGPLFGRETPFRMPAEVALIMKLERASMARMKIKDKSGSPCLPPLKHWNSSVGEPLTKTEERDEAKML